ncbi:hypothetical protein FHS31_000790 [Sphingomonas vulcanisoli]|uniref:Uncharacterized protein n=1 Tax=Sphingomonas vulcanisoli TaxID=1658060 RepID=A0ABX0TNU5_9SPHN|nr:hypothetical protein [Sphingomonas vulcanisoli]NIJ07194.1 hypothetical protein [Sphingomonas vulcanisoli]
MIMNGKSRATFAHLLKPFLEGKGTVTLSAARHQLHCLMPDAAHQIDGKETSHILRRAGFARAYGPAAERVALYKRVSA